MQNDFSGPYIYPKRASNIEFTYPSSMQKNDLVSETFLNPFTTSMLFTVLKFELQRLTKGNI